MTHADTILRIAVRVAALGSERDAHRLRDVVVWILDLEVRLKEFESVEQRLKQCEAERDHIRELEIGLRSRTKHGQGPTGQWIKCQLETKKSAQSHRRGTSFSSCCTPSQAKSKRLESALMNYFTISRYCRYCVVAIP